MTVDPAGPAGPGAGRRRRRSSSRTARPRSSAPAPPGSTLPAGHRAPRTSPKPGDGRPDHRQGLPRRVLPGPGRPHRRPGPGRSGCCSTPTSWPSSTRASPPRPTTAGTPPTGWLVRFDPAKVALADPHVRVQGTLRLREAGSGRARGHRRPHLRVRAAPGRRRPRTAGDASLFTVRRELHFRSTARICGCTRTELQTSTVEAGPQACSADVAGQLRPLLAGQRASAAGPAGTDPYATGPAARRPLCGTLAPGDARRSTGSRPEPARSALAG